ncbi:hypothetical protein [Saccharopolyspora endophytica]|uniref:hypothetical protein n=1 Tax=Saccharopolyspora endophytica TaxID=543886 RepID=UPI001FE95665|nr:hypothetical protein [Saccharopolyspora endophytica]
MIDPRREAVLILNRHGRFEDRTAEVTAYRTGEDRTTVTFRGGKSYPYGADKVRVLRDPSATALDADARVEVDGVVWSSAREILTFRSSGSPAWCRVRYSVRGADRYRDYPAERVKVVTNAARSAGAARILDYWREIISRLPTSRHIKDLVGHIRYQNPDDEVVDSSVISVFDLLYSRYSHRLRALADRIRPVTGPGTSRGPRCTTSWPRSSTRT